MGTPRVDEVFFEVIDTPEARKDALIAGNVDVIPGPYKAPWAAEVSGLGFNQSFTSGFYEGLLVFNCRDTYGLEVNGGYFGKSPGDDVAPLDDSVFRKATQYVWGMEKKNISIFEYYEAPWIYGVQSIVPPAQTPWCDGTVVMPNSNNVTAWAILTAGGYYVNSTDDRLYNPDGTPVRDIEVVYPLNAPQWGHIGGSFVSAMNAFMIYIGATSGPTFTLLPTWIDILVHSLLFHHDFDIACLDWFMCSDNPDWLYDMFHSINIGPWGWNVAGVSDAYLDTLLDSIKFQIDIDSILSKVSEFQQYFRTTVFPCFPVYSGAFIHTYHPVLSPPTFGSYGYGLAIDWTRKLSYWSTGANPILGTNATRYALVNEPSHFTPIGEPYLTEWHVLGSVLDSYPPTVYFTPYHEGTGMSLGLLQRDPFNHTYMPWIAYDWDVNYGGYPELEIENGTKVTFYLRSDVTWHDGKPFTSADCVYAWELIKNYNIRRFNEIADWLVYAEPECPYKVTAYIGKTSLWIPYLLAATANLFPKHIWSIAEAFVMNGTWTDLREFDPGSTSYKNWTGEDPPVKYPFLKALIGTGPAVFYGYSQTLLRAHCLTYEEYWARNPVIACVNAELRANPNATATYNISMQNIGYTNSSACIETGTVDVHIYEDDILIQTWFNITLDAFENKTIGPFATSVLSAGPYSVKVEIVESGTGVVLHTYTHIFAVTIREDINYDYRIDIKDIALTARAFGRYPGHFFWYPKADINDDFKIDIRDIATIAKKFGWTGYP